MFTLEFFERTFWAGDRRLQQKAVTVIVSHSSAADGGHIMQAESEVRMKVCFD